MTLVAISGKRRSGKSLLGSILQQKYGFIPLSLAAPLKQMCRDAFGLSEEQTDGDQKEGLDARYGITPRELMIRFGGFYRSIDQDFWVKRLFNQLKDTPQAQMGRYVITDMRFKNEYAWLRRHGAQCVRLERMEEYTGAPIDDPSETELDTVADWDLLVPASHNRTPEDLAIAASVIGAHSVV